MISSSMFFEHVQETRLPIPGIFWMVIDVGGSEAWFTGRRCVSEGPFPERNLHQSCEDFAITNL